MQPTRDPVRLRDDLSVTLASTSTTRDMDALLSDLCTPAEVRTLAESAGEDLVMLKVNYWIGL